MNPLRMERYSGLVVRDPATIHRWHVISKRINEILFL